MRPRDPVSLVLKLVASYVAVAYSFSLTAIPLEARLLFTIVSLMLIISGKTCIYVAFTSVTALAYSVGVGAPPSVEAPMLAFLLALLSTSKGTARLLGLGLAIAAYTVAFASMSAPQLVAHILSRARPGGEMASVIVSDPIVSSTIMLMAATLIPIALLWLLDMLEAFRPSKPLIRYKLTGWVKLETPNYLEWSVSIVGGFIFAPIVSWSITTILERLLGAPVLEEHELFLLAASVPITAFTWKAALTIASRITVVHASIVSALLVIVYIAALAVSAGSGAVAATLTAALGLGDSDPFTSVGRDVEDFLRHAVEDGGRALEGLAELLISLLWS